MTVSETLSDDDREMAPPRKRQRQQASIEKKQTFRLFVPFRALGLITNHVPFALQTRSHKGATDGPTLTILTCLGNSWALWEGGKMTLLFVGPQTESPISCIQMDGDAVWAAAGQFVIKYIRGKEISRLPNPLEVNIANIMVFGTKILGLSEDGRRMFSWSTKDGEFLSTVQFDSNFTATGLLHPATYLNKILISSNQGTMQLWNIQSNTCVYKFATSHLPTTTHSKSISSLVQAPAIDVVGIGYTSGDIVIHDIRVDEQMMRMFMEGSGIRSLAFRSDGQAILTSASSIGDIAVWDLNAGGKLLHMVRGAHDGAISSLEWVSGQPLMISSGEDNSVKMWLFDSPTAAPRLLKYRSGHHAPPHLIRYYGDDGKQILTASRDRSLRCTSVVRDSRSFEFSQGSLAKKATSLSISMASLKFPPISSIAYSTTRSKDWDDILTSHTDETFTRTWSMQNKRLGKHTLGFAAEMKNAKGKDKRSLGSVKAVCVTACGNFGIAGSSNGLISLWNLQSGIKRRSFDVGPCSPEISNHFKTSASKSSIGRSITGLATDPLNTVLIASTLDGTINFFDFHTANLDHTLILPSSIVSITLHRDSGLLAVICDDMVIRVIDTETRRIVRELGGFRGRVLDLTFSSDSRWLISTSMDSIIRTFDVPTGRLINAFRTSSVATSVSFSPANDFLATSHVDSVGIYLWANRAQYSEVSFQTVHDDDIVDSTLPTMQGVSEEDELNGLAPLTASNVTQDVFSTPPQLDGELVTLTLLPRSRWQTLINLEIIQKRNKPKDPPKAPEKAPFFLPTLPGVTPRFDISQKQAVPDAGKQTRLLQKMSVSSESIFLTKLIEDAPDSDYETFFAFAKSLTPAALDLEIRSLLSLESLRTFVHALSQRLSSHKDFEAVQALQKVFLAMHAEVLIESPELEDDMRQLLEVQKKQTEHVLELVASSLGTLGFVRDTL